MTRHTPPLVAHVIYALTTGGLENGLVNIINRSPSDRYRHVIICITSADDFSSRITSAGVRVIELHKRPGHDLGFYWCLWRLFRQLRPDIIHSRNLAALETQLLSAGLRGVKRVHGEHGREINDLDGSNWKYLKFRRLMRLLVHRYIAVSKDLEAWLIDDVGVGPARVSQIYNGVDHERFFPDTVKPAAILPASWGELDDMLVIGTVGRLTPVKDQQALLQAVAQMRDTQAELFRRVRVMMIGDGPLRTELADLVNKLELNPVVWLPGNRDDLPQLLPLMDVFVLPSLAEGISNTVLEAMAAGVPVVATAVGGNLELVEEGFNGNLVPARDPQALLQTLVKTLEDETERQRQAGNARQRVCQRFDWNRTVSAYLAVYDELLRLPGTETIESTG